MAETSQSKIMVPALTQVAIVVKSDIEKIADNYWNIFGIGPWDIFTIEPPTFFNQSYKGKSIEYGIRVGLCNCGPCQLELIQPTVGDGPFTDFLTEHGEWLHHVQYPVNTVAETIEHTKLFAKMGFPVLTDGYFGDGHYVYIDTVSVLKCIWEIIKMPSSISAPAVRIPAKPDQKSLSKIKVKAITQVGLIVKDIEETMKNYWNILSIGPWEIIEAKPPILHNLTFGHKPGNFSFKVASVTLGEVQLELLQPLKGESIYTDFLYQHGEGLNNLQFFVDDIAETNLRMHEAGCPVLMGGGFADGNFAYYDTQEALKCVLKAYEVPKLMPPRKRYP